MHAYESTRSGVTEPYLSSDITRLPSLTSNAVAPTSAEVGSTAGAKECGEALCTAGGVVRCQPGDDVEWCYSSLACALSGLTI